MGIMYADMTIVIIQVFVDLGGLWVRVRVMTSHRVCMGRGWRITGVRVMVLINLGGLLHETIPARVQGMIIQYTHIWSCAHTLYPYMVT